MIILLCTTKYDTKNLQKFYAQLKMIQNIYKQGKIQNCKKYFSKGLHLSPKQFIISLASQTRNKKNQNI
jgi:hypothetical protein